ACRLLLMITIVFCGDIFTDSGTYYNEGLVYHIPPIIRAATYADMNVFKKLIHDGVSIDAEDKDGNTSISLVIMNMNYPQNRNMLAYVLRLHPHMRIKSKDGLMPIHFAARIDPSMQNQNVRHVAIAKLIQFGARMDHKDNKGY